MSPAEQDQLTRTVKKAVADALPRAVERAMPMAIGEALGPLVNHTVRKAIRRARVQAIVGYLVLALGMGYVIHDNRERSTTGRSVLCNIITQGDSTTYAYQREHLLNDAQVRRALRQSAEYRRQLGPAPSCSPGITPPPMPNSQAPSP